MDNAYLELRERLIDARDEVMRAREQGFGEDAAHVHLQAQVAELRGALEWRESEVKQLQAQVEEMRATKFWKVGEVYWRAHSRVKSALRR